jgi:hypothetical protein
MSDQICKFLKNIANHPEMLSKVGVGKGVLLGRGVAVITGAGVQVGGRRTSVGVGVGISIVGTAVGGGNGLTEDVGLAKMANTTATTTTALMSTSTERISHILIFIVFPPKSEFGFDLPLL